MGPDGMTKKSKERSQSHNIRENSVLGIKVNLLHLPQDFENRIRLVGRMILLHLEPRVVPADCSARLLCQQ